MERVVYNNRYDAISSDNTLKIERKPNQLFLLLFGIYLSYNINGFFGSVLGLRGEFNLALSLLVIIYAALITPNFINRFFISSKAYLLLISLLLIGLFDIILGNSNTVFLSFLPVIVYYISFTYLNDKQPSKGLITWLLLNIIYKVVLTVYWLRIDELIVKRYDHIGYAGADGIMRSIIGYGAIYFITPCIILWLEYARGCEKWRKIFVIAATLCSVYIVYASQVSMMIFALTIMLLFYFLMRNLHNIKGKRIVISILVIAVLIYIFRVPILTFLSGLDFLGSTVNNRINGLLTVLSNDIDYVYSQYSGSMVEGDSVVNRFYSYAESIKALLHNFFLGDLTPNAYPGAGHSGIIDMICRYGIFTIAPLIALIVDGYKKNMTRYKEHTLAIGIVYLYIVAVSCLNNLAISTVFLIVYILVPQVFNIISSRKEIP